MPKPTGFEDPWFGVGDRGVRYYAVDHSPTKVTSAKVETDTMPSKSVGQCTAKAVERWKLPKPADDGDVVVSYPFILEAG